MRDRVTKELHNHFAAEYLMIVVKGIEQNIT